MSSRQSRIGGEREFSEVLDFLDLTHAQQPKVRIGNWVWHKCCQHHSMHRIVLSSTVHLVICPRSRVYLPELSIPFFFMPWLLLFLRLHACSVQCSLMNGPAYRLSHPLIWQEKAPRVSSPEAPFKNHPPWPSHESASTMANPLEVVRKQCVPSLC